MLQSSVPLSPPQQVDVDGLSGLQASRSQALFQTCDTDGSHAIEVAEILMVFGSNIVLDHLDELVDIDKDGLIDLDEWQLFMVEKKRGRGEKRFNYFLNLLEAEGKAFRDVAKEMMNTEPSTVQLTPMQVRRATLLHEVLHPILN